MVILQRTGTDRVPVEQWEILPCPLPIKHAFAFALNCRPFGFSEMHSIRGPFCNLFKSQLRIFPSVIIELTDYFDLRERQSCVALGFLAFEAAMTSVYH